MLPECPKITALIMCSHTLLTCVQTPGVNTHLHSSYVLFSKARASRIIPKTSASRVLNDSRDYQKLLIEFTETIESLY